MTVATMPAGPLLERPYRAAVGGVPIDPIEMHEAVERAMSAVRARSFIQICTVNLDYLVNARRDGLLRSILFESHLNLADGAPVVWLGRVGGHEIHRRIAGADFTSELMAVAARQGARVFLLGGENRSAFEAADCLRARHPELVVAGVHEPPRASVDAMDFDDILRRLTEARADILLVALGHPKQEKLIHHLRDRLPVSVAVGVGCTFDLIAGHRVRAPGWMQQHGLEWFFRLLHEPRRLLSRYVSDACWLMAVLVPLALYQRVAATDLTVSRQSPFRFADRVRGRHSVAQTQVLPAFAAAAQDPRGSVLPRTRTPVGTPMTTAIATHGNDELPPIDTARTNRPTLRGHIAIARPDHWVKQVFVLPGIVLALAASPLVVTTRTWLSIAIGLVSICLVSSSNYVINEVLDAPSDLSHPVKRHRPVPSGQVSIPLAYVQWIVLMLVGVWLGFVVNKPFGLTMLGLWLMGCAYNIKPLRSKDVPYLDVLSESVNNPLRMLGGWYMTGILVLAPTSLLLSYWMVGCYFMAIKRYSEFRDIDDPIRATAYRKSFGYYTLERLLVSIVFYGSAAMLFLGAFIIRYRLELILAFPLVALVMAMYLALAFKRESAVVNPEKLYREKKLMAAVIACGVAMSLLMVVNIPVLTHVFQPTGVTAQR